MMLRQANAVAVSNQVRQRAPLLCLSLRCLLSTGRALVDCVSSSGGLRKMVSTSFKARESVGGLAAGVGVLRGERERGQLCRQKEGRLVGEAATTTGLRCWQTGSRGRIAF